jgi:16S rRNA (uracil1498-N3)-methyltransferase
MVMPRCYVPDVRGDLATLAAGEAHHVSRVLRLGPGDRVIVFDGRGGEWDGTLVSVGRGVVTVAALKPRPPAPEPPVAVTIAVGLLTGDQMNTVVRDATVMGAAAIVPVVSAHAARPPSPRGDRERARWERVAIAAAKQCGRSVVPRIEPTAPLAAVLERDASLRVICVEPGRGEPPRGPTAELGPWPRVPDAIVCVGPEGGWSEAEIRQAAAAGARRLDLGPRTLRAEVAPAVALTVLWTRWGW